MNIHTRLHTRLHTHTYTLYHAYKNKVISGKYYVAKVKFKTFRNFQLFLKQ